MTQHARAVLLCFAHRALAHAVYEQCREIGVAAFADGPESLLATGAVVLWYQAEVARELPPVLE